MPPVQTKTQLHVETPHATTVAIRLKYLKIKLWQGIREWCGDNAYERYVQAQKASTDKSCLLTPAEFYVERLNQRYSRPNRCC